MTINLNYLKTRVVRYPLLAVCGFAAIVATGLKFELNKSEWAYWVQALGSITALGVAIFVMSRQNRHATKLMADADKRALLRRAHAVSGIIDWAHGQFDNFHSHTSQALRSGNPTTIRSMLETVKCMLLDVLFAIRAIPAHELGSHEMVSGLHQLVDNLASMERVIGVWLAMPALPENVKIEAPMLSAKLRCDRAIDTFRQGFESLKRD